MPCRCPTFEEGQVRGVLGDVIAARIIILDGLELRKHEVEILRERPVEVLHHRLDARLLPGRARLERSRPDAEGAPC